MAHDLSPCGRESAQLTPILHSHGSGARWLHGPRRRDDGRVWLEDVTRPLEVRLVRREEERESPQQT